MKFVEKMSEKFNVKILCEIIGLFIIEHRFLNAMFDMKQESLVFSLYTFDKNILDV